MRHIRRTTRHLTPARTSECLHTGKVRFHGRRADVKNLHMAATPRHFATLDRYKKSCSECRRYLCHSCRVWHLTSKSAQSVALAIADGRTA